MKNKRFAPEGCESCASFEACQGACPLYWSFAGTDELRSCAGGAAECATRAERGLEERRELTVGGSV